MLEQLKRPEILSPAGDQVALRAAIDAGCDAVYFGIAGFNMRAAAKNFSTDDLKSVVAQCHETNVDAYLALNTIVFEDEVDAVRGALEHAAQAGVDGVICWDPAVLFACRECGLQPHMSTQISIANSQGILFYHRTFDIRRFVLARECTLDHIQQIRESLGRELGDRAGEIELEVFGHGAMCVSVSGRCFMSEHSYGRSGNRGDCLQPCRREFRILDTDGDAEYEIGRDYVLSPKDICTLPFIEKLIHAGISSIKIEGRNRSPEYVSIVTAAYRRIIDFYFDNYGKSEFDNDFADLKLELLDQLKTVFNRGFSAGFYLGRPIDEWCRDSGSKATRMKQFVGIVVNYYAKVKVAEIKVQSHEFEQGDELMFQGPTTGVVNHVVDSIQIEHKTIQHAPQGSHVAVKVPQRLRVNDKVFVWCETPDRAQ